MKSIATILGDIKLAHTIFALPYALISTHLAFDGEYNLRVLLLILGCMFFARSAAMSFNRFIDSDIDAENPRTVGRALPSGKVSRKRMIMFTVICCAHFIGFSYLLNFLCFILSFPALLLILGYSYLKRFTSLTHILLGLALGIAPVGAWLAVRGSFDLGPIILSVAVLTWVAGFDIIYSLQDIDFDRSTGLHSVPAKLGPSRALMGARVLHSFTLALLFWFGVYFTFGLAYWIGFGLTALLLLVEHWMVKPSDFSKVGYAFFTANGAVSVLLFICVLIDRPQF